MNTSTVDPNTWLSLDLSKKGQEQVFKNQLVQHLKYLADQIGNQLGAYNIATLLNSSNFLTAGSMLVSGQNLGTLAVNTSFDCKNALVNVVVFTFSAGITLTLLNLAIGSMVVLVPSASAARTLLLAAKTPANVVYTSITLTYAGGGTAINMISTGQAFSAGVHVTYVGGTLAGPALNLVGS